MVPPRLFSAVIEFSLCWNTIGRRSFKLNIDVTPPPPGLKRVQRTLLTLVHIFGKGAGARGGDGGERGQEKNLKIEIFHMNFENIFSPNAFV